MGLVNYVVPFDQLESFTYGMAKEIAENAPLSLSSGKKIMNLILRYQRLDPEIIKEMNDLRDQGFRSEDCKEGQRAFKEKRTPGFQRKIDRKGKWDSSLFPCEAVPDTFY